MSLETRRGLVFVADPAVVSGCAEWVYGRSSSAGRFSPSASRFSFMVVSLLHGRVRPASAWRRRRPRAPALDSRSTRMVKPHAERADATILPSPSERAGGRVKGASHAPVEAAFSFRAPRYRRPLFQYSDTTRLISRIAPFQAGRRRSPSFSRQSPGTEALRHGKGADCRTSFDHSPCLHARGLAVAPFFFSDR